ncbi:FadR/GntR family transcriptional regulator [Sediminispirochaeta smaragdinae]|uniref:GntR domain protein n=1 Tax=Sediminispirochaeta smaragdinae (strain DSM 11293 / JCM 15392 / SEBR 4228) TaxID=573413 RepID=E1R4E5_SEDSS|nr:FCD domain-containing protein [Sediminispirochaeta smaragdinae]ADK81686.1 GntR domain protein [Sediminispirochaeta smaragdinae DSM 11293]
MTEGMEGTCSVIVDYVINQIADKNYAVGDKLPPERDLALQLGISRATVREGIKVLNYLGFIDSTQGSGNYITDTYEKTTAKIMSVMYVRGDVSFRDFTIFRQMLELQAFDLAIDRATEDQITEMKQIVDLLDLTKNSDLIFQLDIRFHTLLVEASHNSLLLINFNALSSVTEEYMFDTYHHTVTKKTAGFEKLQGYHHAIVNALINKDREAGSAAIRDHFSWISPK